MVRRWISSTAVLAVGLALAAAPVQAAGAAASYNPNPLDFGNVQTGSALGYVTVTNLGSVTRTFRDATLALGAGFSPDDNVDPSTPRDQACSPTGGSVPVPAGGTCRLYYRFTSSASGTFSAQPQIQVRELNGDLVETDPIVLRAAVYTPNPATTGAATFAPTSLAFGSVAVGASKTLSTTLTNTSNGNVQVRTSYPSGAAYADAEGSCRHADGTALVLAPKATCTLAVTFTPTLNGAASSTLTVSLSPSSKAPGDTVAPDSSTVLVKKTVALSGTGVGAKFTLTPTSLSFGSVTVNGAKSLTVKVTNTSTTPLEFGSPWTDLNPFEVIRPDSENAANCLWSETIYSDPAAGIYTEDRSQAIAPNKSCVVTLVFDPIATGAVTASIPIRAYSGHVPAGGWESTGTSTEVGGLVEKVSGTGVPASWTATPASLSFGNVTVSGYKKLGVTYKNTSSVPLQFGTDLAQDTTWSVAPSDDATSCMSATFESSDPSNPFAQFVEVRHYRIVAPGASCVLTFGFGPTELGKASATLPVQIYQTGSGSGFDDAGFHVADTTVAATGTSIAPTFTLSPTSLAFGSVTQTGHKSITMTVKNTSPVGLNFGVANTTQGQFYADIPETDTGQNCMIEQHDAPQFPGDPGGIYYQYRYVAPGASCTIVFTYGATQLGATSASFQVEYFQAYYGDQFSFAGNKIGQKAIAASGTGTKATFTATPTTLAFGNVTLSGTKKMEVTFKNTSNSDANLAFGSSYSSTGAPYRLVVPDHQVGLSCFYDQPFGNQTIRSYRSVPPGGTCTMTFSFSPTVTGAAPAASFPIEVYSAFGSSGYAWAGVQLASTVVKASGSGVAATFTLTPTSLAFGTVKVGSHKVMTTVIKNTATSPVSYKLTSPSAAYRIALVNDSSPADCISNDGQTLSYVTVAPGASCDLRIDFVPTARGALNKTLRIDAYAPYVDPGFYSTSPGSRVIGTKNLNVTGTGG